MGSQAGKNFDIFANTLGNGYSVMHHIKSRSTFIIFYVINHGTMEHLLKCPYCPKADIWSRRGLTQHIASMPACKAKQLLDIKGSKSVDLLAHIFTKSSAVLLEKTGDQVVPAAEVRWTRASKKHRSEPDEEEECSNQSEAESDGFVDFTNDDDDDDDDDDDIESTDGIPSDQDVNHNDKILTDFQSYVRRMEESRLPIGPVERVAIELMWVLRSTKASLDTYEVIMDWHFCTNGMLLSHESVGRHEDFVSRPRLFKMLFRWYNLDKKLTIVKQITLPYSKAKVKIVVNDTQWCIQSLLTDPRITDDDYLFFGDDPFSPPPDDLDYIGDINTGLAYTEMYAKLITKPGKQVLLPVIFYIDGAATGQFAHLPVTPLKFTLGIFNRKV